MLWRVHPRTKPSEFEPAVVEANTPAGARRAYAELRGIKNGSHMGVCPQQCSTPWCYDQADVVYGKEDEFKGPTGAFTELVRALDGTPSEVYLCNTHNRRFTSSIFTRLRELEGRLDDLESR